MGTYQGRSGKGLWCGSGASTVLCNMLDCPGEERPAIDPIDFGLGAKDGLVGEWLASGIADVY